MTPLARFASLNEKPSDCLRVIAKLLEAEEFTAEQALPYAPIVEIAYQALDRLRYCLANMAGLAGARVEGPPAFHQSTDNQEGAGPGA